MLSSLKDKLVDFDEFAGYTIDRIKGGNLENEDSSNEEFNHEDLNNEEFNREEFNNKEFNQEDLNNGELNQEDLNNGELNQEDLNNGEFNQKDLNREEDDNEEFNQEDLNNEENNNGEFNQEDYNNNDSDKEDSSNNNQQEDDDKPFRFDNSDEDELADENKLKSLQMNHHRQLGGAISKTEESKQQTLNKPRNLFSEVTESEFEFIKNVATDDCYNSSEFKVGDIEIENEVINDDNEYKTLNSNSVIITTPQFYKVTQHKKQAEFFQQQPEDKKGNFDILGELNNNSTTDYLSYDKTKSELMSTNYNYKTTILTLLQSPIKESVSKYFNIFAKFISVVNTLHNHRVIKPYIGTAKIPKTTFNNSFKSQFNVIKVPREISDLIKNIQLYFSVIKNKLKLNEKTGYYEMIYNNAAFPILCRHVYMTLNDENLYTISDECSINGSCKYCGDVLASIDFDDTTLLPSTIAELVYILLNKFDSLDDEGIFLYMYNLLSSIIDKYVEFNDENFDGKAIAVCSLYCYAIFQEAVRENILNPETLTSTFKKLATHCAEVGWDEQKIDDLLKSGMFTNLDQIVRNLTTGFKAMGEIMEIEDIFQQTARKEIIELRSKDRLNEFMFLLRQAKIDSLILDEYAKKISKYTDINYKISLKEFDTTKFDTFNIFSDIIEHNCIIHGVHDYNGTVCKYCGLKKNLSNIEDIYNKYNIYFNTNFDMLPVVNFKPTVKAEDKSKLDNMLKKCKPFEKAVDHIKQLFNLNDNEWKFMFKQINRLHYQIVSDIKTLIVNTVKEDIKLSNEDIIRLLVYLEETGINKSLINCLKLLVASDFIYIPTHKNKQQQALDEDEDIDED